MVEALVGLGWTAKVAEETVAGVLSAAGESAVDEADVAGALRAALRVLGAQRG
ncbi:hypothetical protein GCM10025865_27760 [Paraoerskovia sediminicola]|uniref:Holliday junction DNA helicase RuvA C-terminal domain-containing protein n=1 Tax=Paraoerskovia sediminicola TaxID=1138587 RepID=A0ABN6XEX9_9CELL|nr:hypothetical protein GCM10025865_27760 [Paraoerskovia sediminicola]